MKLHTLTNTKGRKARKRVGRGDGNNWGKTAGRGGKGQSARSGSTRRPHFEGGQIPLFRRLPKKGFNNRANHILYTVVNLYQLEESYQAGETVTVESLFAKGLIGKLRCGIKVLGTGELTKALTVQGNAFSATATAKITAAGGKCEALVTTPKAEDAPAGTPAG